MTAPLFFSSRHCRIFLFASQSSESLSTAVRNTNGRDLKKSTIKKTDGRTDGQLEPARPNRASLLTARRENHRNWWEPTALHTNVSNWGRPQTSSHCLWLGSFDSRTSTFCSCCRRVFYIFFFVFVTDFVRISQTRRLVARQWDWTDNLRLLVDLTFPFTRLFLQIVSLLPFYLVSFESRMRKESINDSTTCFFLLSFS